MQTHQGRMLESLENVQQIFEKLESLVTASADNE